MENWGDKTTNQILLDITNLKEKHEFVKQEMIKLYDEMEKIEKDYTSASLEVQRRLNKTKNV